MKKASWTTLKRLIGKNQSHAGLFLTLINEKGEISCASARMVRKLELNDPRKSVINFFDLVHPANVGELKQTLVSLPEDNDPVAMELYVKNGHYQPMKWKLARLQNDGNEKKFFCAGYNIVDDERLKRFRHLIQNNSQQIIEGLCGVIFHDNNGELIAANQKAATIFNTTLENLYQLKNISWFWDNEWQITNESGKRITFSEAPFIKAIRAGQVQTQSLIIRLRTGENKCLLFHSQPLPDEETPGQFYAVSHLVDITPEHHLLNQLKDGQAMISAFFQQTPTLSWVIDEETNIKFASDAFYKHFEVEEKDCINVKIAEVVPPSVYRSLYEKHLEVFKTCEPVQTTEKIKWADGTQSISHINIFPICSVTGNGKLVGGHAINLPDKSKLEKELKEAHERLLNFSRATSDAIWEWDMQTGQMFRNEALMEMIGYQLDNSRGLSWWLRRIHPEDRNRLADKIKEATENFQQSWHDEYRFKCADGSYKHVQDKGFVVYENGLAVKMIGSLQDVSSLKELENELANVQMQKQKEMSETIIKMQEKERTRIGHELHDNVNQILSTVKLFFDGITPSNAEQRQLKQKSIEYLHLAIEEIRKLSRELVTPQLKEGKLTDTIDTMISDLQLTGALKISFAHNIDDTLLSGSKKITLFRILQEQLKNIIRHSNATTTRISLQTINEAVVLAITDNGKGFDPHHTRQGIGLTNIHERTQFYDGTVDISSAVGKGCTLTVTIPVQ